MRQEFSDDLADAFIPDARYMSERISHIGEWEPKAQAFLPSSHSTWIPLAAGILESWQARCFTGR